MVDMAPSTTTTDPVVDERIDTRLDQGDHDRFSHYVRKQDEMRGYVLGEPVVALCGKTWVPSRDPSRYPVCPECKEIHRSLTGG